MMYSIVGVGVKVLESSSGYLDAVCDSHNFYQMAAQIFGTDFVDEVHEFRKAKTARCSPRNPSLNFLVEEMREGRVSQEPKRERAANSLGANLGRLPVGPSRTLATTRLVYPA